MYKAKEKEFKKGVFHRKHTFTSHSTLSLFNFFSFSDQDRGSRPSLKKIRPVKLLPSSSVFSSLSQSYLILTDRNDKHLLVGEHLSIVVTPRSPHIDKITHYNYLVSIIVIDLPDPCLQRSVRMIPDISSYKALPRTSPDWIASFSKAFETGHDFQGLFHRRGSWGTKDLRLTTVTQLEERSRSELGTSDSPWRALHQRELFWVLRREPAD